MKKLSAELDVITPFAQGKLVYLDYPIHGNVGDLLIWAGAGEFFRSHNKTFLGQYSIDNISYRTLRHIEKCDTICFHGGGNFGDLWPWHQKFREKIITEYPNKRIVILPQSVHFQNPEELDKSCALLKQHSDLHIFLRDKKSLSILHDKGLPNLRLCPDMAHALWEKIAASSPSRHSSLYLLRRDKEESALPDDIAHARASSADWDDLLTGLTKKAYHFGMRIHWRDARMGNILPACRIWQKVSGLLIGRAVRLFEPHETIITNRLHGVILAALLNRKAIACDNSYGKISSYIDLWMKDLPGISAATGLLPQRHNLPYAKD